MIAMFFATAALAASWAPSPVFTLVCTGTQTGYQELSEAFMPGKTKLKTPWSESIVIDLNKGTFCSQGCAKPEPISSVGPTKLIMANSSVGGSSSMSVFDVSAGSFEAAEIIGGQNGDRYHLEKSGSCTVKPLS